MVAGPDALVCPEDGITMSLLNLGIPKGSLQDATIEIVRRSG